MKTLLALLAIMMLSGCIFTGPSSIDRTNTMIQENNRGKLEAFGNAMAVCDEKPGCLVAVSMAFAGNMGQQNLLRPESTLDYIREIRQWIDPIGQIIDRIDGRGGVSGDRAGSYVKGDGNVILMGNKAQAGDGSLAGFGLSNAYTKNTNTAMGEGPATLTGPSTILPPEPEEEEEEEEAEDGGEVVE